MRNSIESAVVMSENGIIHFEDLPSQLKDQENEKIIKIPLGSSMAQAEKQIILETLHSVGNNKVKASNVLKIGRRTLYRKLDEYGIE